MTALPRPFVVAAVGQLVSATGGGIAWFAVTLWVWSETGSVAWFGALVLATMLPGLLAGPALAGLVDRSAPARTMVLCDSGLLLTGVAMLALWATDLLSPWSAVAFVCVESVLESAHWMGFTGLVRTVGEEHLEGANGLVSLNDPASALIGPAAGGAVFAVAGLGPAPVIDVLSYLVAVLAVVAAGLLRRPARERAPSGGGVGTDPVRDEGLVNPSEGAMLPEGATVPEGAGEDVSRVPWWEDARISWAFIRGRRPLGQNRRFSRFPDAWAPTSATGSARGRRQP